jgi:hypothetical protein
VGPQAVAAVAPAASNRPYVPGGTIFSARADKPLDSFYTAPGSPFTATVVTPLRDMRGEAAVPVGARVRGTFVSSGSAEAPRIVIRLDAMDTKSGTLPLTAVVREAQHVDLVGPTRMVPRFSEEESDPWLERGPTAPPPYRATPTVGYVLEPSREVRVPRGALIELQLTAPLRLR